MWVSWCGYVLYAVKLKQFEEALEMFKRAFELAQLQGMYESLLCVHLSYMSLYRYVSVCMSTGKWLYMWASICECMYVYLYMNVLICTCKYVFVRVPVCECMYVYWYLSTWMCICVYECLYVYWYVCVYMCIALCVFVCVPAYLCLYITGIRVYVYWHMIVNVYVMCMSLEYLWHVYIMST